GTFLKKKGRRPILVGADIYRPAARKQLEVVGKNINVPFYTSESQDALQITKDSIKDARERACDVLILDTAGRLH
ncbi:MAG: signal recognition particle protein, partial [Aliifodinibius sp.]|nr:signal recognition particle protein [Fodinibius sp.]